MRTSEEIYHRVRWDPRFDPARFVLGINQRGAGPKRVPLPAFVPGGEIPWHRVLFVEADGELLWDRASGVDRIDASRAGRARGTRRLRAPFFTARTPHVWDPVAGWCPGSAPAGRGSAAGLRVLTWNTLWDRYDSDRIDTAARRPMLLAALERADADVIALQEVEAGLLAVLLAAPWVRARYAVGGEPAGRDVDDSGLLLLSRLPVAEAARHVLGPHKAVAAVTVESAAGPVVVATTHLSSDHSPDGAARRRAELARLAQGLAGLEGDLVLLGDFNDGGDAPAAALGMRDAWHEARGPGDGTPTFDPVANPLAAVSSLSGRASRLDRVLLRGAGLRTAGADLRGDVPGPGGLYVSDHYGVDVELAVSAPAPAASGPAARGPGSGGAPGPGGSVVDAVPTARTALAWIPPDGLWPELQRIREEHDPQAGRWPPHVNVLFGFVPESEFERAAGPLADVAAGMAPFAVRLDGVHTFGHREDATVWLDPAAAGAAPWEELRRALEGRFPGCRGRAEGYTPHLTLGRSADPQRLARQCAARLAAMPARVGELVLLSRRGTEPMAPRAVVALGTGGVRWLDAVPAVEAGAEDGREDDSRTARAARVARRLSEALGEGVVHLAGSRRMGCAAPGADLDLVAALPGTPDMAVLRARVAAALPGAAVRQVTGARVPGLRSRVADLDVDLVVVGTGAADPAHAVARRAGLGEAAAVALSAVSDADAVRDAVGGHREEFARLAGRVKAWARARGLDSAPFGGLPGLAWAVLAARTVREAGVAGAAGEVSGDELLRHFFATWAAWDWREAVALIPGTPGTPGLPSAAVSVMTPTEPVRLCSAQVGTGGRDLLTQELYRAWEILQGAAANGTDPWPELVSPPPLHRRHAAWAVLTVRAVPGEEFESTLGRFRGRVRALLTALERHGTTDAHAWPRPFTAGPGAASYAVGLGSAPPGPGELAGIAGRWADGLPGVTFERVECGAVPTLR